ncbi:MAG TPA: serine hydrolase [Longimicrobium sp.]|nr:serine hydrolase [Longimicrobium sp.]
MARYIAYHGVTAAQHQARGDALASRGFRPISLNVSGDPADARYAAVWVQRPGTEWRTVHGYTAGAYQARFDELVAQGFAPTLLSATGPVERATFCALFEKGVRTPWIARHGLAWEPDSNPDTITYQNRHAFADGFIPRCLVVYGTPERRGFAGIWTANTGPVPWGWWWADPDTYQRFFDAEVRAGMRPAWVAEAEGGWILSVFRGDQVGEWWARHRITAQEYQAEFNTRVAAGAIPIMVQAGGTGSATRYASVFARREDPLPRTWTVNGAPASAVVELDRAVRRFMTEHAIRAGAVACGRRGRIVLARGYTWAEPGYPATVPGTLFRIASLAKIFTAACIAWLVDTRRLEWSTPAFPFLGIHAPLLSTQLPDPRTRTITVEQLVLRRSGLREGWDDGYDMRSIALRLGIATPPTRDQVVRFMYGEPLAFAPGTDDRYSNVAFTVLTSVIERASGRSYLDFLRREVLAPMGITDMHVAATRNASIAGEVPGYDDPGIGPSQLQPAANVWEPAAYGGDFVLENGEGSGGLRTSAPTLARFIATHPVWNQDHFHVAGRELATRYGTLDGTCSGAQSRGDGLDVGYVFNRRVSGAEHDHVTALIGGYLDAHGSALT